MKNTIWISFDLGVRGDYEGLYAWLDNQGARECGDSVAYLKYQCDGDLLEALKKDLEESIEITKKTRIYITYRDPNTGKMNGNFLIGGRKASPWEGFAGKNKQMDTEEE